MLNLNRIRESRGIQNVSNRKPLSDLISESYELLYNCESPKLRTLLEAHIKDIRENPNERTYLNNNLNDIEKGRQMDIKNDTQKTHISGANTILISVSKSRRHNPIPISIPKTISKASANPISK